MKVNFVSEYKKYKGFENMKLDLSMLDYAIKTASNDVFVRFYGWKPKCLSFGRNQKEFIPKISIDTVRRPTGGRALLHDVELTYCVVGKIPKGKGVIETYTTISDILIKAFLNHNISLHYADGKNFDKKYCMNISSRADVCYMGKKLIGSAQYRKEGYYLQHGSILKDVDFDLLETIFDEEIDKSKIITLKEINPNLSDEDLINSLKKEFVSAFKGLKPFDK